MRNNRPLSLRRLVLLLLVLNLGLASALWIEGLWMTPALSLPPPRADASARFTLPILTSPDLSDTSRFAALKSRSLFELAQKASISQSSGAAAASTPVKAPQISLLAVIVTPDIKLALAQGKDSPNAVWLREGMTIAGWMLADIQSDHIEIRQSDRSLQFYLADTHKAPDQERAVNVIKN